MAFRYQDGRLITCQYSGMTVLVPRPRDTRKAFSFGRCAPMAIDTGIARMDLRAEAARSGVPTWWRPRLSRRRRCATWAAASVASRSREAPWRETRVEADRLQAHLLGGDIGGIAWTVLLYLPDGEPVTAAHVRDVESAMACMLQGECA